jgi:transposase InsO family protein
MSQRQEFVFLAQQEGANRRELCRRFGIAPSTAYKWLERWSLQGLAGLQELSRRPHHVRCPTPASVVEAALAIRQGHRTWGGRKIRRRLLDQGCLAAPAPSTLTDILRRHDWIAPPQSRQRKPLQRFERAVPNELWQMDFKGHFPLCQGRCHPLTVLDDHSRFALCLKACTDERMDTVRGHLTRTFQTYGLPWEILCDNGPPWAASGGRLTHLTVWLIRLGITVRHGRAFHPQTQGKEERFHRTLKDELLAGRCWHDVAEVQARLDPWRDDYNLIRPHEALNLRPSVSRYRPSTRPYPPSLPPVEYGPANLVRKVQANGRISYQGRRWFVSEALAGQPVVLRPTPVDGQLLVFYCHQHVAEIDLRGQN